MQPVDWLVFAVFLSYVIWDGVRRGLKSDSLESYYAGSRSIPWWAAGLSVMATQASAITVIGTTGQGHDAGMDFLQTYFGLPFAMILLSVFMVPLFRENPILTAYEYLEGRFGPATRTLASVIFLISRCLAFGVVIYAPAAVLTAMTGLPLVLTVVSIGAVTTLYTALGGVKAVIWTDVKQMSVIIAGLFLTLGILLYHILPELGFIDILRVAGASGKLNAAEISPVSWQMIPNFRWEEAPRTFWEDRYNLWSGLFGGLFLMLSYFGCDQSQVQRILTNEDADESRKTLLMSAFAKVPMQVLILFIGALLYLFNSLNSAPILFNPTQMEAAQSSQPDEFQDLLSRYELAQQERRQSILALAQQEGDVSENPGLLARHQQAVGQVVQLRREAQELGGGGRDTNYIFAHFILNYMPPFALGLLMAAIFAAAMSSADSALNALSSSSVVDLYKRWIHPSVSQKQAVLVGRLLTLFWGSAATYAALQFTQGHSVVELINLVGSYFYGSLLGVFLLALVWPRAGGASGFWGLLAGMGVVWCVAQTFRVEFLWFNVVGCVAVLVVGILISFVSPRRPSVAESR